MKFLRNKMYYYAVKKGWEMEESYRIPKSNLANISKMKVWEYIACKLLFWGGYGIKENFLAAIRCAYQGIITLLFYVVYIPVFPILALLYAVKNIKNAKKEMAKVS